MDGCSVGGGGVSACWTGWEPVIPPGQLCVLRCTGPPQPVMYDIAVSTVTFSQSLCHIVKFMLRGIRTLNGGRELFTICHAV